jgi:hypothetical protein
VKPEVPSTLQTLAGTLLGELAPQLGSDYAQKTAGTIAGLLAAAAEEWDRAAERRVDENRAMRRLFSEAAPHVRSTGLRRRLELAARGRDYTVRLSALDASNARLRALLIELHAHVETVRSPQAEQIETQIWEELRAGVARRAIEFWPL